MPYPPTAERMMLYVRYWRILRGDARCTDLAYSTDLAYGTDLVHSTDPARCTDLAYGVLPEAKYGSVAAFHGSG